MCCTCASAPQGFAPTPVQHHREVVRLLLAAQDQMVGDSNPASAINPRHGLFGVARSGHGFRE
jgi:hypothetical protein